MTELLPTRQAADLRRAITDYVTTAISLADPSVATALDAFLEDEDPGSSWAPTSARACLSRPLQARRKHAGSCPHCPQASRPTPTRRRPSLASPPSPKSLASRTSSVSACPSPRSSPLARAPARPSRSCSRCSTTWPARRRAGGRRHEGAHPLPDERSRQRPGRALARRPSPRIQQYRGDHRRALHR